MHTGGASDIIRELDYPDRKHPLIQGLLKWYAGGQYFDGKHWLLTVPSNNDYPHAPWWHTESDSSCHTDYNGTAPIAGFIVRYAEPGSRLFELGLRVAGEAIEALSDLDITDMHTCACYIRMKEDIERAGLSDLLPYETLKQRLHASVNQMIVSDRSKWNGYICRPSRFLSSRESEYYAANQEIAEYECAFIIDTRLADGSWDIPWQWEDYPDEWAVSRNWWKGAGVISNLLYLKGFHML
ncbi:MAG: hypothetical protein HFE86_07160 [Clostridiales bacterium]|nr:hypothetical protein [Clostridiales bacterium]